MPLVVANAAKALGETGNPAAAPALVRVLGQQQRSVRFAVVDALLALGPVTAAPVREALGKEGDQAARWDMELVLAELASRAAGRPPTPTGDLLEMSPELLEQMTRDAGR